MSVKSLLQFILLLLIILIIGGIYFIYFYSGPLGKTFNIKDNQKNFEKELENINADIDQEILEGKVDSNENKLVEENKIETDKSKTTLNENKQKSIDKVISYQRDNFTKEIEYINTNKNGDTFRIFANYGETSLENKNILNLKKVTGNISSAQRSKIFISSENAKYNYTNQNSQFSGKVKITYDKKEILCDNLDLNITENIAVAYNNVIVKNNKSIMKAQIITLDIITKDLKINSDNKIKIFTN
tara:strand:- start:2639 stop:3370 length:732 start_codon:yes stop_codon:yes gene_type:complete